MKGFSREIDEGKVESFEFLKRQQAATRQDLK
jgi:hypothetical protein